MPTPRRRHRRPLLPVAVTSALALAVTMAPAAAHAVVAADATTSIADVQGTGDTSPLVDQFVTVEGVVTADHTGPDGFGGLYLQTPGSGGTDDATPDASDGVFVVLGDTTTTATPGDLVSVEGVVGESFGLTQIDASGDGASVTRIERSGNRPAPVPTDLPDDVVGADREALEGMLVAPTGEYRVSSTHQVASFGTVWLSAGTALPVTSTEVAEPGSPEAEAIAAGNAARRLLLDDGRDVRVDAVDQPYLDGSTVVRNGDGVDFPGTPYVLGFGFDDWRLQPLEALDATTPDDERATFVPLNPRPEAPTDVGGDLAGRARSTSSTTSPRSTTDDPDARGARSPEQLAVQRSKIVAADRRPRRRRRRPAGDRELRALRRRHAGRRARGPRRRTQRRRRRCGVGLRADARARWSARLRPRPT